MSDKQNDGGPAFPIPMIPCDRDGGYTEVRFQGMTLRDYFAMQGMLTQQVGREYRDCLTLDTLLVMQSFAVADAMLRERERKPT